MQVRYVTVDAENSRYEAAKRNGADGAHGIWESNGLAITMLRERGFNQASSSSSVAGAFSCTKAAQTSPNRASGTPTTWAMFTAGWCSSTSSTSAGATFSPPTRITSLKRPTMER
jgi:hypothetical protein